MLECLARRRLLQATLPDLAALQELRVFSAGCVGSEQLAHLPGLLLRSPPSSAAGSTLRELSLSFAPAEGFAVADLDPLAQCAPLHETLLLVRCVSVGLHWQTRVLLACIWGLVYCCWTRQVCVINVFQAML